MILHTVNKSPTQHRGLATCLEFVSPGDAIVLLEDGVYAAVTAIEGLPAGTQVYAVRADIDARGLADRVAKSVLVIDYAGFVALCIRFSLFRNWS